MFFVSTEGPSPDGPWLAGTPILRRDHAPFRQPERVFFNPYNPNEIWISRFGSGLMVGILAPTVIAASNAVITITVQ